MDKKQRKIYDIIMENISIDKKKLSVSHRDKWVRISAGDGIRKRSIGIFPNKRVELLSYYYDKEFGDVLCAQERYDSEIDEAIKWLEDVWRGNSNTIKERISYLEKTIEEIKKAVFRYGEVKQEQRLRSLEERIEELENEHAVIGGQ